MAPQYGALGRQLNILLEDPTAPSLELYSLSFWVVQGAGKTVMVNYRPGSNGIANRFLRLVIPKETQLYRPDRSVVAPGDSVQVTGTIDARQLLVQFEPHGLVFAVKPASLRMYWTNANLDVNADGLVDGVDAEIIRWLLVMAYQAAPSDPWAVPGDQVKSLQQQYIEVTVPHFSGFAISW